MTAARSTVGGPFSGALTEAAAVALDHLAVTDPGAVLVTGRDPGYGGSFCRDHPERWVVAPGRQARLAVAAGIALSGRAVVAVCEDVGDVVSGPWELGGRLVAVTESLEVATAAWEAGVRVAMPTWHADAAAVLAGAPTPEGSGDGSACVYLQRNLAAVAPPLALDPFSLDRPRTIVHGEVARIGAAGALVDAVLEAAWHLARRGTPVTVVQLTCLTARDPSPELAMANVFWDTGRVWDPVAVPDGAAHPAALIEEAVLARLSS